MTEDCKPSCHCWNRAETAYQEGEDAADKYQKQKRLADLDELEEVLEGLVGYNKQDTTNRCCCTGCQFGNWIAQKRKEIDTG